MCTLSTVCAQDPSAETQATTSADPLVFTSAVEVLLGIVLDVGRSSVVSSAEWFVLVPTGLETPVSYIPWSTAQKGTLSAVGDCTETCGKRQSTHYTQAHKDHMHTKKYIHYVQVCVSE